jgi:uncharacterized protein YjbI with pentapeptide repeats
MANRYTERKLFSSTSDQWNEWTWNTLQKSYEKRESVKYRRYYFNLSSVDWHNLELEGYYMSDFSFRNSTLKDIIFTRCSFESSSFRKSTLARIHFFDCIFVGVDFTLSRLEDCDFNSSDLILVNFTNTLIEYQRMDESSFASCLFKHTQIDGLSMNFTAFLDCDLRQISGLGTISKDSSAFLDVNTIAKSKGRIPDLLFEVCQVDKKYRKQLKSLFSK